MHKPAVWEALLLQEPLATLYVEGVTLRHALGLLSMCPSHPPTLSQPSCI